MVAATIRAYRATSTSEDFVLPQRFYEYPGAAEALFRIAQQTMTMELHRAHHEITLDLTPADMQVLDNLATEPTSDWLDDHAWTDYDSE